MKTFQQFSEAYDSEFAKSSQVRQTGEGGRIRPKRKKSEPETRRVKAIGGGKTAPVTYKDRKDIGQQRQQSDRVQQPKKERGSAEVKQSYADKVKAERRAAAKARAAARKSGGEVKKDTTSSKDKEKAASKLLTKKTTKTVSPNYKPAKASGYTRAERMKIQRKGETIVRNAFKDQETAKYKKETGQNPDAKGRTKIMGRVHKRMSENTTYNDPEHSTTYGTGSTPQSGTVGGTTARFKKRPKTGLGAKVGNLAKDAGQSIKNAGKNALSRQKPKDTTYRGAGAGRKDRIRDKMKSVVKNAAQKKLTGRRPGIGMAQRPDLGSGPKPKAIGGSPQRKALPGGSSAIQKRGESRPARQSGIQPVRVTVLGKKRAGYLGSGDKKKVSGSSQKQLPAAKKQLPPGR